MPADPEPQSHGCGVSSLCEIASLPIPTEIYPSEPEVATTKKYPPLTYGQPKPLVCSRPHLPKGALSSRPNLQVMWENYLYAKPAGVWPVVGGAVEINGCLPEELGGWKNACTVRLSHMLNKAGHKIPFVKGQTVSGGNGDQYFFRLEDAELYLKETFGTPDVNIEDASGRFVELPNHPGLLIMRFPGSNFTGHATVWNGAGAVDGSDVAGFEIYFWKLPCFIPSGRTRPKTSA